jgi:hypothetical protein
MFVEDIEVFVGSSKVTDRILVLGDFNLPKVEWGVQEDGSILLSWASQLILRVI